MTQFLARRHFLGQLGAMPLVGASILSAASHGAAPMSGPIQAAKDRATGGALYWAWWGWEPWEHHRRAGGTTGAVDGDSHWLHAWYDRLHSEDLVRQMADAGVNLAVTHFFKGFGLQHERGEQQRTAALVKLAHKHGIRVLGYCQFRSIYYETFLLEEPSARDWVQRDPNGRPVPWNAKQYFRWCPCINSREFRAYIKRAVRIGLEETGLDGFNFDNCISTACYCPRCQKAFREWMIARYPQPRELFGLGTLAGVEQPPALSSTARIEEPLTRAWIRWRCECLEDFVGDITGYARSLRPEVILMANPGYPGSAGAPGRRSMWTVSVGRQLNLMIAENSATPEIVGDTIISQIRAYRHGIALGYRPASTTWAGGVGREATSDASLALPHEPHVVKLQVAEAAANRGVPGANWLARPLGGGAGMRIDLPELREAFRQYLHFVRRHEPLWLSAAPVNDVAVLRTFPSEALDAQNAWDRAASAEEVLIRGGFAWGALFGDQLDRLADSAVLVVAGQTHLSADACRAIKSAAAAGRGVVVLGDVARWDENGQPYDQNPLADLSGPNVIRLDASDPSKNSRLKYVLAMRLPKDWRAVSAAVTKAAQGRLTARLHGSTEVALSAFRTGDGRLAVHLVNYAAPKATGPLRLELGPAWRGRKATLLTPETPQRSLAAGDALVVPPFAAYGIVVVEGG